MGAIKAPNLLELNLEENSISKMETFEGHAKLIYLNLNKNKLTDLLMVKEMPNLVTLKLVIAFVVFGDFVRGRINSRSIMG